MVGTRTAGGVGSGRGGEVGILKGDEALPCLIYRYICSMHILIRTHIHVLLEVHEYLSLYDRGE